MSEKNLHVVPRDEGWAVRSAGRSRDTSRHATQAEAIRAAKRIAQNQGAELVIHGRDGHIRSRDSHCSGPVPPRGGSVGTAFKMAAPKPKVRAVDQVLKAIASLPPKELRRVRTVLETKLAPKKAAARSPKWPDFLARQKALFGEQVLTDSQAILDETRADRF